MSLSTGNTHHAFLQKKITEEMKIKGMAKIRILTYSPQKYILAAL
jgi:hypothetical protein